MFEVGYQVGHLSNRRSRQCDFGQIPEFALDFLLAQRVIGGTSALLDLSC
jgi:hypothetical protein